MLRGSKIFTKNKDMDPISIDDLDFELLSDDVDSGLSSPGRSDFSDFSYGSPDLFVLAEEDAIKMGESIINGGPIYNPFIRIKTEIEPDKSCSCYCCDKNVEDGTDFMDKSNVLNFLDSLEDPMQELLNTTTFNKEMDYAFMDTSLFDLSTLADATVKSDNTEKLSEASENQVIEMREIDRHGDARIVKSDHNYCKVNHEGDDSNDEKEMSVESSDEEFIPEPVLKKKRTSPEPKATAKSKDKKYLEKRKRNNIAAKRSREARRQKEIENMKKSTTLEKENASLNKQVEKLKKLIAKLEKKLDL